jgi:hypothetical protein
MILLANLFEDQLAWYCFRFRCFSFGTELACHCILYRLLLSPLKRLGSLGPLSRATPASCYGTSSAHSSPMTALPVERLIGSLVMQALRPAALGLARSVLYRWRRSA